ncbi:MAG TPA: carbohydrate kinase family protein [Candidatus Baltobacteraceae bacterium]
MSRVVCIGGACIDRKYHAQAEAQFGTSNPVRVRRTLGGVARNVAENLARLGVRVSLFSAAGVDENGLALLEHAKRAGIDVTLMIRDSQYVTPEYGAVLAPAGELVIGMADMGAVESIRPGDVEKRWNDIAQSDWLFVDCNVSGEVLAWCIAHARAANVKLAIDAVSEPKVRRLPQDLRGVDLLVLNEKEAAVYLHEDIELFRKRTPLERAHAVRSCGAGAVILTRGVQGLVVSSQEQAELPALRAACVDETGAGDALIAAVIYRLTQGDSLLEAARTGSLCAGLTVESRASVRPDLTAAMLESNKHRLEACTAS